MKTRLPVRTKGTYEPTGLGGVTTALPEPPRLEVAGPAVRGGVRVHADIVDAGSEHGLLPAGRDLHQQNGRKEEGSDERGDRAHTACRAGRARRLAIMADAGSGPIVQLSGAA